MPVSKVARIALIAVSFILIGAKKEDKVNVLELDVDQTIPVLIRDNVVDLKLLLNVGKSIHLSNDVVSKLKLRGSLARSFQITDKSFSQKFLIKTQRKIRIDEHAQNAEIVWKKSDEKWKIQGAIGPELLTHYDIIRMNLKPEQPDETRITMSMIGLRKKTGINFAFSGAIKIGEEIIIIQFDPSSQLSLATTKVGLAMVKELNGQYIEDARKIEKHETSTGLTDDIEIRLMDAGDDVTIGGLLIDQFYIIDNKSKDGAHIPSIKKRSDSEKEDEILVIGHKKKFKDRSFPILTLGQQSLKVCSSIEFNKKTKKIKLSCSI